MKDKLLKSFLKTIVTIIMSFIFYALLRFGAWLLMNYLVLGIMFFSIGLIAGLTLLFFIGEE